MEWNRRFRKLFRQFVRHLEFGRPRLRQWLPAALVVWLIVALLMDDISHLDVDPIGGDATQNFYSAMNLSHHGIYSEKLPSIDVQPGYRREPIPVFVLAGYLKILSYLKPSFVVDGFLDVPDLLYSIKAINLFYSAAIMVMMWILLCILIGPRLMADGLALPLIWCCHEYLIVEEMNGLNTEVAVGFCILLLTLLFLKAYQSRFLIWVLFAGSALGLLSLTKAVAAYLAVIVIPLTALFLACKRRSFFNVFVMLSLGFVLTISPWLLRNQIVFGKPVIAQGGGDVLLIRALFNTMTPMEYRGAFYAYSPDNLQSSLSTSLLPFSPEDLECNGRLERLNRKLPCDKLALEEKRYDDVRSLYRRGKHAIPRALGLSREQRQAEAIRRIQSMPLAHLSVSIPLAWRGFWAYTDRGWLSNVVNACAFGSLLLAPVIAIVQKRMIWIVVSIVPFVYFVFHASLTHFIPRYSEPLIPISLITLGMLIADRVSACLPVSNCYLRR